MVMKQEVVVIVGGGPGISASCARVFVREGMQVAIAARNIDKPVLRELEKTQGVVLVACDAADEQSVVDLFDIVVERLGNPNLVCITLMAEHERYFENPSQKRRLWTCLIP